LRWCEGWIVWILIWPSHKFIKALGNQPVWTFGRGHHALSTTLSCPGWPWSPACVLAGPACRFGQLWPRAVVSSPLVPLSCPRTRACCPCRLSAAPVLKEEASAHGSSLDLSLLVSLFLSITLLLVPLALATSLAPASRFLLLRASFAPSPTELARYPAGGAPALPVFAMAVSGCRSSSVATVRAAPATPSSSRVRCATT
jgi:hypothetical protein